MSAMSIDIYITLKTKNHNKHYLDRYWKFIQSCVISNKNISKDTYTENHHILPKAKDLFPEYESFTTYPENKIRLTPRQHFICHWMLWKTYGGTQVMAFKAMCNNQSNKYQKERYYKINSRIYEKLKIEYKKITSPERKGKAAYFNSTGEKVYCSTQDPRVLSGEFISTTLGRKMPPRTKQQRKNSSISLSKAKYNPNKKIALYFLTTKIEVLFHSSDFVEYLEQGWSLRRTKEHHSNISKQTNKLRTIKKNPNKKVNLYFMNMKTEALYYNNDFVEYLEQGWSLKSTKEHLKRIHLSWCNPNRKIKLYFLENCIEVLYYSEDLVHYIDQGWIPRQTREHKSKFIIAYNKRKNETILT